MNQPSNSSSEELFDDWFTINVLDKFSPKLPRLGDECKPIKLREREKVKRKNTRGVCFMSLCKQVKRWKKLLRHQLPQQWQSLKTIVECQDKRFNSFAVDYNGLLNIDNCLVIPKVIRENVLRAVHFGHAGRDSMLRKRRTFGGPSSIGKLLTRREIAKNAN